MDNLYKVAVRSTAKDTVFTHLFSDPEYRLQFAQALHPEMKDLPLPEPEFYVIYTGTRKRRPEEFEAVREAPGL